MVGTQVVIDASLPTSVFVYDSVAAALDDDPVAHFCASHMIVIDGIEWQGMESSRRGLIHRRRPFKGAFHPGRIAADVASGLCVLESEVDALAGQLFPGYARTELSSSYRPMITGPEPLHFDVYDAPLPIAVSFVNLASTPRRYRVGPSFKDLVSRYPDTMKAIGANSYRIRCLTMDDQLPMPKSGPAHQVELAPGSVWFFNTKTLSHEVVYGEGAFSVSWTLPDIGAPTQEQLLRTLQ